jgi:hypothetical protein
MSQYQGAVWLDRAYLSVAIYSLGRKTEHNIYAIEGFEAPSLYVSPLVFPINANWSTLLDGIRQFFTSGDCKIGSLDVNSTNLCDKP